jgi:hypothetical protein
MAGQARGLAGAAGEAEEPAERVERWAGPRPAVAVARPTLGLRDLSGWI